jgi:hypothetical protein
MPSDYKAGTASAVPPGPLSDFADTCAQVQLEHIEALLPAWSLVLAVSRASSTNQAVLEIRSTLSMDLLTLVEGAEASRCTVMLSGHSVLPWHTMEHKALL